jgi:hypothetical protein
VNAASDRPVLFLDLDGTLHPNGTVRLLPDGEVDTTGAFMWARILLELLSEFPAVDVVLHSTWRFVWEHDEELLRHLPGELAKRVVGCTPRSVVGRHQSIEAYCRTSGTKQFIVLDDEPSAYPTGLAELVVADPQQGISAPHVRSALAVALARISSSSPDGRDLSDERIASVPCDAALEAAREWHRLGMEAEELLGVSGWSLLRSCGRLMSGPYSGSYVSALPAAEARRLLLALQRGELIPVHLMHRHRSGNYESSVLSLTERRLLMHYPDRSEPAE